MRKWVYQLVENKEGNDGAKLYNALMLVTVIVSLWPMMFKEPSPIFIVMEICSGLVFCVDYLLRYLTADCKLKKGKKSFLLYPLTPMAIIDLLCILPSFILVNRSFRLLKIIRLGRLLRIFKVVRHSKNIHILRNVIRAQKDSLVLVAGLAIGYIILTSLLIFTIEPETFPTFFDALYWATISLTTVGYGDIFAVSVTGKIITMISSLFGVAVVALPAGIITAGYMSEIQKK